MTKQQVDAAVREVEALLADEPRATVEQIVRAAILAAERSKGGNA